MKAPHPPISLAPILDAANTYQKPDGLSKAESITEAGVNSEGTLVITLSNGDGYAYSGDMFTWQRLTEAWWAIGSQYWDSTGTSRTTQSSSDNPPDPKHPAVSAGIIPHLERRTTNEVLLHGRGRFLQRVIKSLLSREGFEGFETAVSIAHLENRMAAAIMLSAKEDFKCYLMMYARRIAAEGMKGKVEELLREMMGRIDVEEDEETLEGGDEDFGNDDIVGWDRRELLKGILLAIGTHSHLSQALMEDHILTNLHGCFRQTQRFAEDHCSLCEALWGHGGIAPKRPRGVSFNLLFILICLGERSIAFL
jgi:protein HIRA/HIR1